MPLVFTGNYDGNADIYVIPSMGGSPARLTHHPDTDVVSDWSPDGDRLAEDTQIAILNMATVLSQMDRHAFRTGELRLNRRPCRVGLNAAAGLAKQRFLHVVGRKPRFVGLL